MDAVDDFLFGGNEFFINNVIKPSKNIFTIGSEFCIAFKYLQSWTKGWRQIDKIKQNRFFYGMVYS